MKLDRYNQKRDFDITAEPSGALHPTKGGDSFVIQKHDATRLHYDFRLELDGVLLSWAVPKGPSLDPKEKRLAVRTEDHPVDYRDFEGNIPHGEYGGGPVIVWDRGTWAPIGDPRAGLKKGRLDFEVFGEKLHGKFTLVRMKKAEKRENWLIFKRDDEHVRKGKDAEIVDRLPKSVITGRTVGEVEKPSKLKKAAFVEPQLATLVDDVPVGKDWVYELKYDGYRILAVKNGDDVKLVSRNGKDWTDAFPGVTEALRTVRAETAVFDGEVCYVEDSGRTDFQHLQNALKSGKSNRIVYFVFDLLQFDGHDIREQTLRDRKQLLRGILAGEKPPLKMGEDADSKGQELFDHACKAGLEGIIAKRVDRPYVTGRSKDWLKIKCISRQELVIAGFTPPKGGRKGLGALLLAVKENGKLRYAGKVGTGFTQQSLKDLTARLEPLEVDAPQIEKAPRLRDAHWVQPKLVCEVKFTEWTRDGALRHPSFEGLREDKKPKDVVKETPKHVSNEEAIRGVKVSHPEREMDKASGLTKIDLVRYYDAVADLMMPFANKRPLMLMRCPDGAGKSCFMQKHAGRGLTKNVSTGSDGEHEILWITKPAQLIELAQFNSIEIHGWGSRMPKLEKPDWVVFDLDPDEKLPFARVVEAAISMRDSLKTLGLESFVKTTGGKGLHVVVPLTPSASWETVSTFAERVANAFAAHDPKRFVAKMGKAARHGKIFVDHFRNGRGATAVLPYSARARDGLGVALPVSWKELPDIDPKAFTIATVPEILEKRRTDPWAKLLETKQTISKEILGSV